jgi:hypothetical protein
MLHIKLYDLEYEIEDVKLSYEIMKLTGKEYALFGETESYYFENHILDLTDDLSDISNNLKMDGENVARVDCRSIDFSSADKILCDVIEKIRQRGKKCDVLTISSTQNDKKLYFYNYIFTSMLDEYHSRSFKYRFSFDFFEFKNK